jgi:hypothetical protein
MAADDGRTERPTPKPNLIAGTVIGFCLALGVIVWAGGWSFSNDEAASRNPTQHADNTSPPAQMPMRSTTGSR